MDDPGFGCEGEPGNLVYSGLAAGLVGTWQIDRQDPEGNQAGRRGGRRGGLQEPAQQRRRSPSEIKTTIAVKQ